MTLLSPSRLCVLDQHRRGLTALSFITHPSHAVKHVAALFGLGTCLLFGGPAASAQTWNTVRGTVIDSVNGTPLPSVTVLVQGTDFGTATDEDGHYSLRLPTGQYVLRYSSVGFRSHLDTVTVTDGPPTRRDVTLAARVTQLEELIVVEPQAPQKAGVYKIDPEDVQNIPTPFKDGFRALKTTPGVATNNELSQQYSVRGGGYNENLIFINGFEVFMPFRARQGEQEGLGLLNPDLASDITFYTGGFPPRYGGKLSSALDVQYARPTDQPLSGSASLSTLDASVHARSSALDGDLGWVAGIRRAQPGRFFNTQDLKGEYDPRFTDLQTRVDYDVSERISLDVLGIWANHVFELEPEERTTYFGVISLRDPEATDFKALRTHFTGARRDGYMTTFGGVRLDADLSDSFRGEHRIAYFGTRETESFDVTSNGHVCQVDPSGPASPENCTSLLRTTRTRFADNAVEVERLTGKGHYEWSLKRHAVNGGWSIRRMHFHDRLREKNVLDGRDVRIRVDSLNDTATFTERQLGFYLQDGVDVFLEPGRLTMTGGLRSDYYSFNDEWTVSPRLSAQFRYSDRLSLSGSVGLYHQQPAYRELRGHPEGTQTIDEALNRDIVSQRSVQLVAGGEYFLPERRLYVRAEGYYKKLSNIISYTIEDVRVNYSGENDADGYTYGVDLQLRGEFVPGLESWFNYGFMVARERFKAPFREDGYNDRGWLPRPSDQRHTFSAFVQDYVPGDNSWKLHMRLLYGSGLPYTAPEPGPSINDEVQTREPGPRMRDRLPAYRRVDVGATKEIEVLEDGIAAPVTLDVTIEILNLFDMDNAVAYSWTEDFTRVPKRLTPRTLNARLRLGF